jgi:hypothetical protein
VEAEGELMSDLHRFLEVKVYATASDMYNALTGCGCCCYDYDNGFDELKAMILKEAGIE